MKKTKIWADYGGQYYLSNPSIEHEQLENAVYTVKFDEMRREFYLIKVSNEFQFDYKIYGLESDLIKRVIKTYESTKGNLGLLLNGVKGTGKTVSSKIIANKLNQPTIIVSDAYKGVQYFLNSIPQNITIFIDEYEKIYGQSNEMLTIMDGAMNSEYRRMFLLTTNKLYIEDNLKQRPSRIRYIKKFNDLAPSVVEEIVDDILTYPELRADCLSFMTTLSLITVDIVKAIINEVNIHNESPYVFGDVFNVEKIAGKFKVFEINQHGQELLLVDNANIYPRPEYDEQENYWFEINGQTIGKIMRVVSQDTIIVGILDADNENVVDTITIKARQTFGIHSNYAWSNVGNANNTVSTTRFDEIMKTNNEIRNQKAKKKKGGLSTLINEMEAKIGNDKSFSSVEETLTKDMSEGEISSAG